MDIHLYTWIITVVVMIAILGFDVFIIGRRPHEPSMKEAGIFIGIFVALAIIFGLGVWAISGPRYAGEFFAGWLTEYSLSIDNLFIFIIIMGALKVPRHLQQFALMVGIILALIFRGIFIAIGAAAIARFSWIFFVFGAFLIYTAVKLVIDYRAPRRPTTTSAPGQPCTAVRPQAIPLHRRLPRHEAHRGRGRQAPHHADVHRHRRLGQHRPAVRARLDPGDLRADRRSRTWSSPPTCSR